MTLEQFKQDLKRILSLVSASQRFLEEGKVVELGALETRVADLCKNAQNLDPQERQEAAPFLAALQSDLNLLEEGMRTEHASLQRQLKGLNNSNQAVNAYTQAARNR
ncbi:hypothetical protein [uncultured Thalassospira sp.]|jgi:hypothetical protein|uniref:hypothetical protein n=1 Tax=uncultured Thalassospira sp. TaxID=404382 RepID=UPI0030DA74D2|tara:strand:+ start:9993 stop:10313 length:321 start_codon:yes stop_codon:yes gene_type:complete